MEYPPRRPCASSFWLISPCLVAHLLRALLALLLSTMFCHLILLWNWKGHTRRTPLPCYLTLSVMGTRASCDSGLLHWERPKLLPALFAPVLPATLSTALTSFEKSSCEHVFLLSPGAPANFRCPRTHRHQRSSQRLRRAFRLLPRLPRRFTTAFAWRIAEPSLAPRARALLA